MKIRQKDLVLLRWFCVPYGLYWSWRFFVGADNYNKWLFHETPLSAEACNVFALFMACATLLLTLALVIRSKWVLPSLFLASLSLGQALIPYYYQDTVFWQLSLLSESLKIGTPLMVTLVIKDKKDAAVHLGRLTLAATFIGHGIKALYHHPPFIDFLFTIDTKLFFGHLNEAHAQEILKIIGALDIILAASLLVRFSPPILLWMGIWGLLTALLRPLDYFPWGVWGLFERTGHFVVPLLLFLANIQSPTFKSKEGI